MRTDATLVTSPKLAHRIGFGALALRPSGSGVQTYVCELLTALDPLLSSAALRATVQCDATGEYHHVGGAEGDPAFQGFGAVTTDAEGRYAFRTIKPVPYPGRTPHIHFAVLEGGRRRLVSQMFIEGEAGNARDGLYRHLGAEAKRVTMKLENATAAGAKLIGGAEDLVL